MRARILVRASAAAALCFVGGCAFLPSPRGPTRVGDLRRAVDTPAWTDFLACAVLSDSAARHGNARNACDGAKLDASKPGQPLPRPTSNTP